MGLIKITSTMSEAERIAAYNSNMQYLEKDLPLKLLPIGIIISFDTDVDPNELYGGTWIRIKDRFIYGVGDGETAGAMGGEKEHALTINEMPSHGHYMFATDVNATSHDDSRDVYPYKAYTNTYNPVGTENVGGNQPHNNMPPYYGANTWRRIL